MFDKVKVDLNKPAFGKDSQKLEEIKKEPPREEEKPNIEVKKDDEEVKEPEVPKVEYSRFKNVHLRAIEAELKNRDLEARISNLESRPFIRNSQRESSAELPDYWKELYGDSDASKKAWTIQYEQNEALKAEARELAIHALREEQQNEASRVRDNLNALDENLEIVLPALIGREPTEQEQLSVLDIQDEFTPKDEEGNYLGELLPVEKAWEIYELKSETGRYPTKKSRDNVAAASSTGSAGETSIQAEQDKNWNPLDWNAWRKRV